MGKTAWLLVALFGHCWFWWNAGLAVSQAVSGGAWMVLVENSGVSAMHMVVTHFNTVIIFDRTDYGPSQLLLPDGRCRENPSDLALTTDCYAHSFELDLATSYIRALTIFTDPWCSSGSFQADGTLVNTGGYNDGVRAVRYFTPCSPGEGCDWVDSHDGYQMGDNRWYASNHILPENNQIVIGGRGVFSYEFVPDTAGQGVIDFPFLRETNVPNEEDNLYPFVHLLPDGNLFIFANNRSIRFNYRTGTVLGYYPDMPDGGSRCYPSSGSAVLLPLTSADGFQSAEIMICGGAPTGSYISVNENQVFLPALSSCGRMSLTGSSPSWAMEDMPMPRVMGDMLLLPNGEVLIINGAGSGTAGWYSGRDPVLTPLLYRPWDSPGSRFTMLTPSTIPRMYHSTAAVLPDGRILVGGSNPNVGYDFSGVDFPTELRLETYSPYYLDATFDPLRPYISSVSASQVGYGANFTLQFGLASPPPSSNLEFRLYAPPFTTHTYAMNQRQLVLGYSDLYEEASSGLYSATIYAPPSTTIAPAGYYMLFVVNGGIPCYSATWIQMG